MLVVICRSSASSNYSIPVRGCICSLAPKNSSSSNIWWFFLFSASSFPCIRRMLAVFTQQFTQFPGYDKLPHMPVDSIRDNCSANVFFNLHSGICGCTSCIKFIRSCTCSLYLALLCVSRSLCISVHLHKNVFVECQVGKKTLPNSLRVNTVR